MLLLTLQSGRKAPESQEVHREGCVCILLGGTFALLCSCRLVLDVFVSDPLVETPYFFILFSKEIPLDCFCPNSSFKSSKSNFYDIDSRHPSSLETFSKTLS